MGGWLAQETSVGQRQEKAPGVKMPTGTTEHISVSTR